MVALGRAYFGSGSGEIYLDSVVCNGSEGALQQCTASPIGVHNCDHSEDAGVRCGGINCIPTFHTLYTLCDEAIFVDSERFDARCIV